MKRQKLFATLLFPVLGAFVPAMAQAPPAACNHSLDATWIQRFLGGDDPAIQNSMQSNLSTQKKRLCGSTTAPPLIFPPGPLPTNQPWEEVADRLKAEPRSEEHTSELQSPDHLVCRLLLEKKKTNNQP